MLDMNRRQLLWAGGGALGAASGVNAMVVPVATNTAAAAEMDSRPHRALAQGIPELRRRDISLSAHPTGRLALGGGNLHHCTRPHSGR